MVTRLVVNYINSDENKKYVFFKIRDLNIASCSHLWRAPFVLNTHSTTNLEILRAVLSILLYSVPMTLLLDIATTPSLNSPTIPPSLYR